MATRSQRQGKLLRYDVKNEFCLQGTCLLPARCPPYIARLVGEGVIPAAERICRRWPRPKIAQKRLEASPPWVNANSLGAVVPVAPVRGLRTPGQHRAPARVGQRARVSMCAHDRNQN